MSGGHSDRLVRMANQIALNMASWGDETVAAAKTADHLQRFWTPAMRAQLADYCREDDAGLSPVVKRALAYQATEERERLS